MLNTCPRKSAKRDGGQYRIRLCSKQISLRQARGTTRLVVDINILFYVILLIGVLILVVTVRARLQTCKVSFLVVESY